MASEPTLLWLESSTGSLVPVRGHVSLGRSRVNTIPINCDKVSRRHASIHQDEQGNCLVMDLGSSNGTYLNGARITHLAHAKPGDTIEVGSARFTLRALSNPEQPDEAQTDSPAGAQMVPCWIVVGDKENPGRSMTDEGDESDSYKTTINWAQGCQQILNRNHASVPAGYDDAVFGYWRDPQKDPAIAASVVKALREMQVVQARQRLEFRLAVHLGTVVIGSSESSHKKALIGTEVTFAFQMQRLAWVLSSPCLISEEANRRLGSLLPTRALDPCGLRSYHGDRQFFSL